MTFYRDFVLFFLDVRYPLHVILYKFVFYFYNNSFIFILYKTLWGSALFVDIFHNLRDNMVESFYRNVCVGIFLQYF